MWGPVKPWQYSQYAGSPSGWETLFLAWRHGPGHFEQLFSLGWFLRLSFTASRVRMILRGPPLSCARGSSVLPKLARGGGTVMETPPMRLSPHQPFTNGVLVLVVARSCYKICLRHRLSFLSLCRYFSIFSISLGFSLDIGRGRGSHDMFTLADGRKDTGAREKERAAQPWAG